MVEKCYSYVTSTVDGLQNFRKNLIVGKVCNQKHCLPSVVCIEILKSELEMNVLDVFKPTKLNSHTSFQHREFPGILIFTVAISPDPSLHL